PMASCQSLNVIEAGLRDIMQNSVPFGGKIIILGGDFQQVLPIIRHGSQDEKKFSKWLLQLGDGSLPTVNGEIQQPPECIISGNLITDIFGKQIKEEDLKILYEKVILCAINKDCLTLNEE
ncbi:11599_t:CDS:2, partial [Acaulospora morrowiae]